MFYAPVPEDKDMSEHVDALWLALAPHADFIRELKSNASVEIVLGYSSNIDHAGLRIPYGSLQMFIALELDLVMNVVVVSDDE